MSDITNVVRLQGMTKTDATNSATCTSTNASAAFIVRSIDFGGALALLKHASYVFLDMFCELLRDQGFYQAAESCLLASAELGDVYAILRVMAGEYEEGDGDESEEQHHALGMSIVRENVGLVENERVVVAADKLLTMMFTGAEGTCLEEIEEEIRWILSGWPTLVAACGKAAEIVYTDVNRSELLALVQEESDVFVPYPAFYDDAPRSKWDFYKAMTAKECKALAAYDAKFDESDPDNDVRSHVRFDQRRASRKS